VPGDIVFAVGVGAFALFFVQAFTGSGKSVKTVKLESGLR
jgi:hypothetical protein